MIITNRNRKRLRIFESFRTDDKLLKYNSNTQDEELVDTGGQIFSNPDGSFSFESSDGWLDSSSEGNSLIEYRKYIFSQNATIINWIRLWFVKVFMWDKKTTKKIKKKELMTVPEFFNRLSNDFNEIDVNEIGLHYEKALVRAHKLGQSALVESLKNIMDILKYEIILKQNGVSKYVSEKQVIDFYEKVGEDKALKLTWITNFARMIPDDVFTLKQEIDKHKVFDNYVILHYDPENNGEMLTQKEIEKKKDPILFGVIKNSDKLYYIADWKDEYCQLTLQEMLDTLEDKVFEINNESVKTFIDKTKAK